MIISLTWGLKCSSRDHQAFHPQLPSSTPASTSSPTATLCCSGGGEEAREQVPSQETESSTFFNRSTHFVSQPMAPVRIKRNIVLFLQSDVYCLRLHLNIVSFSHLLQTLDRQGRVSVFSCCLLAFRNNSHVVLFLH